MTQFGTDPHYLHRADSIDTSIDAAYQVDTTRLERLVYETIHRFGQRGCISDEVRALYAGYPYSSITARYRALLDKGFIEDTGERRQGVSGRNQRVMRAVVAPNQSQLGDFDANQRNRPTKPQAVAEV